MRLGFKTRWPALLLVVMLTGCWDLGDSSDAGAGGLSNNCLTSFYSCGGDVSGTWSVQSICPSVSPIPGVSANLNFTAYPDCSSACTAASLTARGQKKYDSGTLTSSESFQLGATLSLNDACFNERQGTSLTDSTCQAAANADYVSCGLALGACNCQSNQTFNNTATTYSVAGSTLTEMGADSSTIGPTVAYCLTGNIMLQQRTLPPGINYVIQYARQ